MNIKTLLLGTATAISMVGGAQAADLAVAEPVDYVKVCDAYGAGYFYIPGTDTCLKIGGFIRSYVDFSDYSQSYTAGGSSYFAGWNWTTQASLQVTAQSMTDIGLLTGFLDYRVAATHGSETFDVDSMYLKAGPMKLGYFTNFYNYSGGFLDFGAGGAYDAADNTDNQLVFSTSAGGLGLWLGIVDNKTHNGVGPFGPSGAGAYDGNAWPDIVGAITGSAGGFDWKLAAAVTDTVLGTGWGFQAAGTWTLPGGDGIRAKVAVGNGEGGFYVDSLGPQPGGTLWSALVSGVHYWSSTFGTALTAGYTSRAGGLWDIGAEANWTVAKNLLVGVEADFYAGSPNPTYGDWSAEVRVTRSF
jgi:hypothetical protein